jgi:hypothetical protein
VLSENQFIALMDGATKAREFQSIECIQTCIKTKSFGIGKHIPFNFSMQVDLDQQKAMFKQLDQFNLKTTLDYKFKHIGEEYEPVIIEEA